MKARIGSGSTLLALLALTGCASLDGRNSDSGPWAQPFPQELSSDRFLGAPVWVSFPEYYEEQRLHSLERPLR